MEATVNTRHAFREVRVGRDHTQDEMREKKKKLRKKKITEVDDAVIMVGISRRVLLGLRIELGCSCGIWDGEGYFKDCGI